MLIETKTFFSLFLEWGQRVTVTLWDRVLLFLFTHLGHSNLKLVFLTFVNVLPYGRGKGLKLGVMSQRWL